MFGKVEAFALGVFGGTQAHGEFQSVEQDGRDNARPHNGRTHSPKLRHHLASHVIFAGDRREHRIIDPALTAQSCVITWPAISYAPGTAGNTV